MQKITYSQLLPYIEKGLISERIHPDDNDIRIYNYTNECQYSSVWDDVTINCRGLIMNIKTGEYLSNAFPKFFNYNEHLETGGNLPDETPEITDKLDGCLGILYWINNKPMIATRGAFMSEMAKWSNNWLENNSHLIKHFDKRKTYLFEIISPVSKIILKYNFTGLILLGIRDIETGQEDDISTIDFMPVAERYDKDVAAALTDNIENKEGYVLFYRKNNLRLKIKFEDYVRLHKIITGVNKKTIWEALRDGKTLESLLNNVPDEFFKWVHDTIDELNAKYIEAEKICLEIAEHARSIEDLYERVNFVKQFNSQKIIFNMLAGKKYRDDIWKRLKPLHLVDEANND